jgi:hypothetical protein
VGSENGENTVLRGQARKLRACGSLRDPDTDWLGAEPMLARSLVQVGEMGENTVLRGRARKDSAGSFRARSEKWRKYPASGPSTAKTTCLRGLLVRVGE